MLRRPHTLHPPGRVRARHAPVTVYGPMKLTTLLTRFSFTTVGSYSKYFVCTTAYPNAGFTFSQIVSNSKVVGLNPDFN